MDVMCIKPFLTEGRRFRQTNLSDPSIDVISLTYIAARRTPTLHFLSPYPSSHQFLDLQHLKSQDVGQLYRRNNGVSSKYNNHFLYGGSSGPELRTKKGRDMWCMVDTLEPLLESTSGKGQTFYNHYWWQTRRSVPVSLVSDLITRRTVSTFRRLTFKTTKQY